MNVRVGFSKHSTLSCISTVTIPGNVTDFSGRIDAPTGILSTLFLKPVYNKEKALIEYFFTS